MARLTDRNLADYRIAPAWSPDGKSLAFVWARFDTSRGAWASGGVAIGDLATGHTRTVFEGSADSDSVDLVRWSGDGRRLLLSINESNSDKVDSKVVSHTVAVISAAGPPSQRPRALTPTALDAGFADWDWRSGRVVYATNLLEQQGNAPKAGLGVALRTEITSNPSPESRRDLRHAEIGTMAASCDSI